MRQVVYYLVHLSSPRLSEIAQRTNVRLLWLDYTSGVLAMQQLIFWL